MTSEVRFVRNNPFIQNDLGGRTCRIVPSASDIGISTGGGKINWECRKPGVQSASYTNIASVIKTSCQDRPLIVLQQLNAPNRNAEAVSPENEPEPVAASEKREYQLASSILQRFESFKFCCPTDAQRFIFRSRLFSTFWSHLYHLLTSDAVDGEAFACLAPLMGFLTPLLTKIVGFTLPA
ncbi:hypothetical protein L596_015255 [Steinernema carpocapsae]|uniref:Uncharacterized protein n=1 Tax=Steinernema carpocapsae TaxID=34508 RepID=A0A4U5NEN4_STECR|nr:hypothetical protein L596_015255 [Steinernema carpocapsae]